MKRTLTLLLAALFIVSAIFAAGCLPNPEGSGRDPGDNSIEEYGELVENGGTVMNVLYSDDTPVTFMYLNFFSRTSDPEDAFVAQGPKDNSVLMFDSTELSEGRTFEDIAAYTDDQAKDWMTAIQLGLVSSQGISDTKIDDFKFVKLDDHLYLYIDVTVTYEKGLIQKNTLVNYALSTGKMYTVRAFAPLAAVEKFGPLFSDVRYYGSPADSEEPVATYSEFSNGTISFLYNSAFNVVETNGKILSMVPEKLAMLACGEESVNDGRTYEELAALSEEEILEYLTRVTALEAVKVGNVRSTEENGVLRLEAEYSGQTKEGKDVYCVVTRFIKKDGSVYTLFAYMDQPAPIKDITYTP